MGAQAGVADEPAPVEGRPHHVHVGQVAAAEIRIVVEKNVAVVHVGCERGDDGAHRIGHRAEVDGQVGPLRHHLAADIEDAAGIVAGRLQQRGVGGLCQDHPHLLGDLVQTVLDDLEGGGIGLVHNVSHGRFVPSCRSL